MMTLVMMAFPLNVQAATLEAKAGAVTVSSGKLNVRSSASTESNAVTSLAKGSYITLLSKSGSWWRVAYGKGQYGYCHADYVTPVEGTAKTVAITSGSLNVRSGAGTGYGRVASLTKGEVVLVLSATGSWSRVLYHGTKTGYVSSSYLSGNASPGSYSAVSLAVPSFKQTDSRWSGTKLGSSGKTIGQIGCTTTAIAMMESYRTGTILYPDAMAKKLSYTSSGSVYWPGDYTAVTSSKDYLASIYQKLKQGKPVLLGMKTASGSQHWVVVTGFTGDSSLSASAFTINDPGSSHRTTLQQFISTYPVFYKYFTW